ncbi:MAG: hypothetical protein IAG13_35000 [Deltaproteobacteria bacterium]|nr:hypothetical protein [Nannocystaceae bacterium]
MELRQPILHAAWALVCVATIGCVEAEPFRCDHHDDCVSSAGAGRCEPTSYCSYDDDDCASNRRYSELAGPFANACVAPDDAAPSSDSVADDTGGDETAGDETTGDETAGDASDEDASEASGEAPPASGQLVWSRLVADPEGGSDRFLAVARTGDRIMAAGQQVSDLSFVALDPETGDVVASLLHDVGGSDDAVHSLVLGDEGELVACGRNDDDVLGRSAWIGTIDAALEWPPFIASFWGDHACHVVTELDSDRMIAAGDGVPLVSGPDYAWMYAFERSNPTLGTEHSNEGQGSVWNAATHVGDEVLFGGRLGTTVQSGKGVVAGLDGDDVPSQFAVFSDALWAVHALAPTVDGFVLGGFESTDGAPAAWVSAHTAAGAERWSWRPGHAQWPASRIEDVAVDGQGSTVAVGSVSDGSDQQRWIVRLDPDGAPLWSYALPNEMTGGRDVANALVVLPGDDIVVVGEAEVAPGETDAWVARFSAM